MNNKKIWTQSMFRFDYSQLSALAAVVDEGSYARAAKALSVTQPAISNRIKALEENLKMEVVTRSRPRVLTEAGRTLYYHFSKIQALESDTLVKLSELAGSRIPTTQVRIAADEFAMSGWMHKAVGRAKSALEVTVDLIPSTGNHDGLLKSGQAHGALSLEEHCPVGFQPLELGIFRCKAVASREFINKHLDGEITPEALLRTPAISLDREGKTLRDWASAYTEQGQLPEAPQHVPFLSSFMGLCMEGSGWAIVPEHLLEQATYKEGLVDLMPENTLEMPVYWIFPQARLTMMRALTNILEVEAAQVLDLDKTLAERCNDTNVIRLIG